MTYFWACFVAYYSAIERLLAFAILMGVVS
jgi:hypothetical protein